MCECYHTDRFVFCVSLAKCPLCIKPREAGTIRLPLMWVSVKLQAFWKQMIMFWHIKSITEDVRGVSSTPCLRVSVTSGNDLAGNEVWSDEPTPPGVTVMLGQQCSQATTGVSQTHVASLSYFYSIWDKGGATCGTIFVQGLFFIYCLHFTFFFLVSEQKLLMTDISIGESYSWVNLANRAVTTAQVSVLTRLCDMVLICLMIKLDFLACGDNIKAFFLGHDGAAHITHTSYLCNSNQNIKPTPGSCKPVNQPSGWKVE